MLYVFVWRIKTKEGHSFTAGEKEESWMTLRIQQVTAFVYAGAEFFWF